MARYTYDPSPIIGLAQAILSYADGVVLRETLLGGAIGIVVGFVPAAAVSGSDLAWLCWLFVTAVAVPLGAFIFRSAALGRVLVLRASAQMLLLMVKIEENTRQK